MDAQNAAQTRAGLFFGIAAHACWGVMPLYVSLLPIVVPSEFLAHRIFWSAILLVGLLWVGSKWTDLAQAWRTPRTRWLLLLSTGLIALNWYVFLYGIASKQAVQNSLGYYTNPLCNVVLGVFLLGERLRPGKWVALAIAASGIGYMMLMLGTVPWIALTVAWSFAFYGLVRKLAAVDGVVGLAFETLLLAGPSALWVGSLMSQHQAVFLRDGAWADMLLILSGPITVVPLLCFVLAARRLPMTTLGFLQYIGPTMQLLTAVLIFREPFGQTQWVGFSLIWTALAIIMIDSLLAVRARRATPAAQAMAQAVALDPSSAPLVANNTEQSVQPARS
jgi:chloramphenicol-sensitive protein RarD